MNDRATKSKAKAESEQTRINIEDSIKALLSQPNGRDFLWWLLTIGKVGQQPFSANALQTSFACGELNVGQQVLARILETDAAGYVRMQQEKMNVRPSGPQSEPGAGSDASEPDDSGSVTGHNSPSRDPFGSTLESLEPDPDAGTS